jgi:hypothetical protein
MTTPSTRERLVGRVAVIENRLRLIDALDTPAKRARAQELTDLLVEARAELDAYDAGGRHRRDVDD